PQKRFLAALGMRDAFASFAARDRERVLARVEGLAALGVSVRMEPLELKRNAPYPAHRLAQIAAADALLLFWSQRAKASSAIEREWRPPLAQGGLDSTAGVPPAAPRKLAPPAELVPEQRLDDWIRAWLEHERTLGTWGRFLNRLGR